jgi:Tc5 transposase-like DNA-binding protein
MEPLPSEARIELAIADLLEQDEPTYRATARKYDINYTTLMRRFKGEQVSRAIANAEIRQRLSLEQEEMLIKHINKLSNRGIPPTSQIVKNLAEEIIGGDELSKNWVGDFVKRYKDRLKSIYLRNMDGICVKAEYAPIFKQFYDMVLYYLLSVLSKPKLTLKYNSFLT